MTRFEKLQTELLDKNARSKMYDRMLGRLIGHPDARHDGLACLIDLMAKPWSEPQKATFAACIELMGPMPSIRPFAMPESVPEGILAIELPYIEDGVKTDLMFLTPTLLTPSETAEVERLFCFIHQIVRRSGQTKTPRRD